ncbi:DNA helicase-2 / ATP-dependent DNA helicase PcrA [Ruminococcus sp. YE71]|uniref:ATP-dependent helicase n=1 Tax=unclassified Ruminococcus TaxID=2608920 RepID=UPI000882E917|nr:MULTISPECIES: UvrD-helicase domain-containing protein [unclassified Ruminococcus]SDA16974.1 DNA helicase-2 / ATP-dependent DNA helicase PcrA [Ruminococcus sp. YE78]SFW25880.1 DNA helicase-2 / ATP-dependent DNA helicase PcrA [Ruminococcus sp. YE71]
MTEFDALKRKALERCFKDLNPMQRKAVFKTHGCLLILAGAGSGKTTVLINRIANMIFFGDAYEYEDDRTLSAEDEAFLKAFAEGADTDIQRLAGLVAHAAVEPWNVLAITFTNKAANELKDRLSKMLGDRGAAVKAATFHSACARILRAECPNLGYKPGFTIYDTDDCLRIIKSSLKELDISDKIFPPKLIMAVISAQKNAMVSAEEYFEQNKNDIREREIARVYKMYDTRLKESNAMDFDDLLVNTVRLFRDFPDVLDHYQNLYKYILVDEYQDTNTVQFKLIEMLSRKYGNLCVVGDDDQSIYRFRGATIRNILDFEETFGCDPETDVIKLEQNYRSTQNILTAANKLIEHNVGRKGKNLWTDRGDGETVTEYQAFNERSEAKYIAKTIKESVEAGHDYRQHAILYRMNAQSNVIEQTFIREGIPYIIFGGQKFYDRKEIKDVIAYLQVINNPSDILRLRRIINEPKRGIGESTVQAVEEIANQLGEDPLSVLRECQSYAPIAKKAKSLMAVSEIFDKLTALSKKLLPSELLDETLVITGYSDMLNAHGEEGRMRLDNIAELKSTMLNYEKNSDEPSLEGFLEEIALYTDIDKYDPSADYVAMMTIHSAKGLEFDYVFVPGMEENVFPSSRSSDTPEELEEERRLAYVAMTRAKRRLWLLHSSARMLYGRTTANRPSRFLAELPDEQINHIKEEPPAGFTPVRRPQKPDYSREADTVLERRRNSLAQTGSNATYSPGEVVIHPNPKFGRGTILKVEPMGGDTMLEIAFESCGTKKIMSNFVRLKKV